MASRAEVVPGAAGPRAAIADLPAAPALGRAIRAGLSDLYFNSLRMVGANLVWSGVLGCLYLVYLAWPFGALAASPLLALPTAGIFRLAALIVRGEMSSFADALGAWRRFGARALVLGVLVLLAGVVFVVNVAAGLDASGYAGWSLATLAFWGMAVGSAVAIVAWPLLVDPRRDDRDLAGTFRLAGLLVLAFPLRFAALTLVVGTFVVASTIAFAALAMVSVSIVALVVTRYVLPASDRFQFQMAERARVRG